MTYEEAKTYLADCNQYSGEFSVEPIRNLLSLLGNPQDQLTFVHIAGTNGKGSVLAYVSTVLKEAGYKVGDIFRQRSSVTGNGSRLMNPIFPEKI